MAFRCDGVPISAELGTGNQGTNYVLRRPPAAKKTWLARLLGRDHSGFVYQIPERDEAGFSALTELRGRGISLVAIALGRSMDHILGFFTMLRSELGFYVRCLNLFERLAAKGERPASRSPCPRAGRYCPVGASTTFA